MGPARGHRLEGGFADRAGDAAAADETVDLTVPGYHGLGAGLCGGQVRRADHGGDAKILIVGAQPFDEIEDFGGMGHDGYRPSEPGKFGLDGGHGIQGIGRREMIDIGQGRVHGRGDWFVIPPSK